MELLGKINESIWGWIFNLFSVLTDNVSFAIFMTSFVVAAVCIAFRRKIIKTRRVFGLPELLYILSVAQAVNRLPMVHERIHTSLVTTSGIILQSNTYMDTFSRISGVRTITSENIARYLYYGDLSVFENAEPSMLYDHLTNTLNETRSLLFFWQVHEKTWVPILFLIVGLLVLMLLQAKMKLWKSIIFYIFQLAMLFLVTWNNGALYAAILLLIFQIGLSGILNTDFIDSKIDNAKTGDCQNRGTVL